MIIWWHRIWIFIFWVQNSELPCENVFFSLQYISSCLCILNIELMVDNFPFSQFTIHPQALCLTSTSSTNCLFLCLIYVSLTKLQEWRKACTKVSTEVSMIFDFRFLFLLGEWSETMQFYVNTLALLWKWPWRKIWAAN